jgi:hypothetical protein
MTGEVKKETKKVPNKNDPSKPYVFDVVILTIGQHDFEIIPRDPRETALLSYLVK